MMSSQHGMHSVQGQEQQLLVRVHVFWRNGLLHGDEAHCLIEAGDELEDLGLSARQVRFLLVCRVVQADHFTQLRNHVTELGVSLDRLGSQVDNDAVKHLVKAVRAWLRLILPA